jgi:hypothetical protein
VSLGPVEGGQHRGRPYAPLSGADACQKWDDDALVALRPADLNERERQAVRDYTDVGHHARLNGLLRGGVALSPKTVEADDWERITALFDALTHPKARMMADATLYRKTLVPEAAKVGDLLPIETAFISCSVDLDKVLAHGVAERQGYRTAILKFEARAGESGYISANNLTRFPNEKEIIRYGNLFKICDIIPYMNYDIYLIDEDGGYSIG